MPTQHIFNGIPETETAEGKELIGFCDKNRSLILPAIPWVSAEIADLAGFDVLFKTLRHHGGMTFYVPHDIERCRDKLGFHIPEKLHDRFIILSDSNGCVNIPSAWGVFLAIRRVAISIALDEGRPDKEIARSFGMSDRSLRTLKAQKKAPPPAPAGEISPPAP